MRRLPPGRHAGQPDAATSRRPNILGNYMDSIHGEGLFKQGLTVTAVCTSCHTAHFVLPHTDPRSSIAKAEHRQDLHASATRRSRPCTAR